MQLEFAYVEIKTEKQRDGERLGDEVSEREMPACSNLIVFAGVHGQKEEQKRQGGGK